MTFINTEEPKYLGILQSIESMIIEKFRENPDLLDSSIIIAYEWCIRHYKAELKGKTFEPSMNEQSIEKELYKQIISLGSSWTGVGKKLISQETCIDNEEWIKCLQKLCKSAEMWNKERGRQGYLKYINEFIP